MVDISAIITAVLCVLFLLILYRYISEPYKYWRDRGIPSPPTVPFLGSLASFFTQTQHDLFLERHKKYGRLYGTYEGRRPVLVVNEPELLRNILVKDFISFRDRRDFISGNPVSDNFLVNLQGDNWKRVRTLMTPAFTSGKIKKMSSIFVDAAKTLSKSIQEAVDSGKPVDCKSLYGAFTMDVIACSAFGTKIDSHNDPNNPFVAAASYFFFKKFPWGVVLFFLFPKIFKTLRLPVFPQTAINFFRTATLQIIEERKRSGKRVNDFLQLMMDSADEVLLKSDTGTSTDNGAVHAEEQQSTSKKENLEQEHDQIARQVNYKGLNYNEMVAQCILFFLAGYDTTGSLLTFVSYALAFNCECQEKLIAEIDEMLKKNKNQLAYEGVQEMKYMDMVISETLRMYPPLVSFERQATSDYKLGNTGVTIPKDMLLLVGVYAMHYDPEFYPDPEKFDPNRFTADEIAKRDPYTYLPFGAGPRNCIGMRFALIETKICLSYIFSQFRVKPCPQTKIPLEYRKGSIVMQPKEVLLSFQKREDGICTT